MQRVYGDRSLADRALRQFDSRALIAYLEAHGLSVVLERGDRYYPRVGGARAVVETLLSHCVEAGVEVVCSSRVQSLSPPGEGSAEGWRVEVEGRDAHYVGRAVIVATGGKSYPRTGSTGDGCRFAESLGVGVAPLRPGLSGFTTVPALVEPRAAEEVLELRNVAITLFRDGRVVAQDAGDVDVRGSLVGGSAVLRVSRWGIDAIEENALCELAVDFRPGLSSEQLMRKLQTLQPSRSGEPLQSVLRALLPKGVIGRVCRGARLDHHVKFGALSDADLTRLQSTIKGLRVKAVGHEGWERSVVTRGGVKASALSEESLECIEHPGLFFCGEVLNVDADTGGYNLQLAFSAGWVAGQHA